MMEMIKKKKPIRLRHELKYELDSFHDMILTNRLNKIFQHDNNADSHGVYRVNSIYFDTPYDEALKQKTSGVQYREKFRIRYYGNDTGYIKLEKKMKFNGLCAKHSCRLTKEEVKKILKGDYEFLLMSENPLCIEFYSKLQGKLLRPKTIVTYNREAFLFPCGNVRITIDRNLHCSKHIELFFSKEMYELDISDTISILEIKYDEFLPSIVKDAI